MDEFLHTHTHMSKEGFGSGLIPTPSSIWAWGKTTFLKTVYKTKDVQQVAN